MIFKSISCRTIFLLIILTHLSSCDIEDITPSAGEGKITLNLDLVEINIAEARTINTRAENIGQLYLTIETKEGKPTHLSRSAVMFSLQGEKLKVEGIVLPAADYQVTEVLVKDYTGDIVYASPLGNSRISSSISTSLPLHFKVVPDKEDQVGAAVVATLGHTPTDFGFEGSNILFKDEAACDGGVFKGDVSLSTQEEINEFGSKCYTGINGNLKIDIHDQLLDLSPLKSLKFVEESLQIREYMKRSEFHDKDKDYLLSLHGLHNLEYAGLITLMI